MSVTAVAYMYILLSRIHPNAKFRARTRVRDRSSRWHFNDSYFVQGVAHVHEAEVSADNGAY